MKFSNETSFLRRYAPFAVVGVLVTPLVWNATLPAWTNPIKAENRTIVITGATGKIGRSIAKSAAYRRARVIMASRDMEKCKLIRRELVMNTDNKSIKCYHLDLEDIDSINKFADEIIESEPHVDVLINNAAVQNLKKKELTKLLDKLKESGAITLDSRVVNVIGKPKKSWNIELDDINFEKRKYNSKDAYRQSKLALAYFTILLEKYNKEQKNHIYVFGVDPVFSYIIDSWELIKEPWEKIIRILRSFVGISSDRPAQIASKCAIDPYLARREHSGKLYGKMFQSWWGWGVADKNENFAKLVWNSAAEKILEISKDVKTKDSD